MWGQATLEIPNKGFCGPLKTWGLSDELALVMGRIAAWTLSDAHQHVIVELSDDTIVVMSIDTVNYELVIGHLEPSGIGRSHKGWMDYRTTETPDAYQTYCKNLDSLENGATL